MNLNLVALPALNPGKPKTKQKGIAALMAVALFAVLGIIMIFTVILPALNTGIQSPAANLTGYTGAMGIAQASYIVMVLATLAVAGLFVLTHFYGAR